MLGAQEGLRQAFVVIIMAILEPLVALQLLELVVATLKLMVAVAVHRVLALELIITEVVVAVQVELVLRVEIVHLFQVLADFQGVSITALIHLTQVV